jgi:radical SAM protein with 4Fe4S-binding SPASM domain
MGQLLDRVTAKASALQIPIQAHLDVTWKCNERCVHCYLDHGIGGDMTTDEIRTLFDQLAAAGTFFLVISGGEIMLRKDIFDIVAHARSLLLDVRLKTNGLLIRKPEAERFGRLGVRTVDISIYSWRHEVHDAVTLIPGSLARSLAAVRYLRDEGMEVEMRTTIMRDSAADYPGIQALAKELGVVARFDPTMNPRLDGDRKPFDYRVSNETLKEIYRDPRLAEEAYCAPPSPVDADVLDGHSCEAGHGGVYITPQGDVTPCVQFPMVCGNIRRNTFAEIWNGPQFRRLRDVRVRNLPVCSTCANSPVCSRCPGLAYSETGDFRAPSSIDCEKSFARTGIPSALMQIRSAASSRAQENGAGFAGLGASSPLVQIAGIQ